MAAVLRGLHAWSHSRLLVFEACKYRAWLQFVERIPKVDHAAAFEGIRFHRYAAEFIRGKGKRIPRALGRRFGVNFENLRAKYAAGQVRLEEEWAFDKKWRPVDSGAKDVWLRMKCDAVVLAGDHAMVIDYKFGKRLGNEMKHAQQMQIYTLGVLLRYPSVDKVTVQLWYPWIRRDQRNPATRTYTREEGMRYLPVYTKRGLALTEERHFKPSANIFACAKCPYGEAGNGKCYAGFIAVHYPDSPPAHVEEAGSKDVINKEHDSGIARASRPRNNKTSAAPL